ncbi:hypothetical protein B0H16DRAFT_1745105 [Mycena metata]|uniref:Uncharacterized protein n=1 Tax=Mycena metata TaxID=1033252 RepID=A0AAD7H462_9AGAR|nr:hypothetical protein B0H16DRAFT_1745105 [Mycena metata]
MNPPRALIDLPRSRQRWPAPTPSTLVPPPQRAGRNIPINARRAPPHRPRLTPSSTSLTADRLAGAETQHPRPAPAARWCRRARSRVIGRNVPNNARHAPPSTPPRSSIGPLRSRQRWPAPTPSTLVPPPQRARVQA